MLFAEKTRAVLSAHMTPDDLPFVLIFFSTAIICLLTLAAIRRPVEDGGTSSYPLPARTMTEPPTPSEPAGIWRLLTKTDYSPFGAVRSSSNGHVGRQVWRFYPASETAGETRSERASRALHDQALALARAEYAREAQTKHHSGDVPYRLQCKREKEAPPAPRRRSLSFGRAAPTEEETVTAALRSGIGFYGTLQMEDGHWPGDYGGPMFLLPGLVIALYVAEVALPEEHRYEMLRYLKNHQNPDGGIGLHIEGHSTMFGTSLNYVAARLLGLPADDPWAVACRKFMHARGGAVNNTSWAKFWLALLGVYDWRGLNPLPPEMWLLPYSLLVHPGRFWCHCRMVYLPMSYLFGRRAACPLTPTTAALREELYPVPYAEVQWHKHRNNCGAEDLYTTHHWTQDALWTLLYYLEPLTPSWLRRRARAHARDHPARGRVVALRRHRPRQQGDQPRLRVLRRPERRAAGGAPAARAGLPLARRGRDEDARVQRLAAARTRRSPRRRCAPPHASPPSSRRSSAPPRRTSTPRKCARTPTSARGCTATSPTARGRSRRRTTARRSPTARPRV